MTLTFFSNYFNHHQKALCDEWYRLMGQGFVFVETEPMEEFRAKMGWGQDTLPDYVLQAHESDSNQKKALELGLISDVVVIGSAQEKYIEERMKNNRLTFRYTERPLKEGAVKMLIPRLAQKFYHLHFLNRNKNMYLLGASAYAAADYKKLHAYPGKCLKFGYFPEKEKESAEELYAGRQHGSIIKILWAGRFLKLKRADLLIKAASILKKRGFSFQIKFVGNGEKEAELKRQVTRLGLESEIIFCSFMKPEEIRKQMKEADIFVMTSNFLEGWGSVIYESLSTGCAVVASHACGSTPWLIKDHETGLIFHSGDAKDLAKNLEELCRDKAFMRSLGQNAYRQMAELWNPEVAASRVVDFSQAFLEGKPIRYESGPLSEATILKNNWHRR